MGKLIVLEGLDGSGKATQAKLLTQNLQQEGYPVRQVSFPNYQSPFCIPVQEYLGGKLGSLAGDVNPYAASILFTIDRFASFRQEWEQFYQQGGIIIADRYTTSNAVHQCSKLPPSQWQEFTSWLFGLEYDKVGIPKPDFVLYLSVEPEVSQKLLSQRYQGQEQKKDIHEKDLEYLQCSRKAAQWCAETFGWKVVQCSQEHTMRPIEEIAQEILQQVKILLKREG